MSDPPDGVVDVNLRRFGPNSSLMPVPLNDMGGVGVEWWLRTAEETRELDRRAIEEGGIPGVELMERAGRSAFRALARRWPDAHEVTVVCGVGNNGGDGFVIARRAWEEGRTVRVLGFGDFDRMTPETVAMLDAMQAAGVILEKYREEAVRELREARGVIVDALFGTGLSRPVDGAGPVALIEAMNEAPAPVCAVDIPSGLNADTGRVEGVAVRAQLTVTFIARKRGLYTGDGPERCGEIVFDSLDVPTELLARTPPGVVALTYDTASASRVLARRPRGAHKGDHGHVLVVGGDAGFAGAARLAGEGAARAGAGLVSVATREVHAALLTAGRPELMCRGVEDNMALAEIATRATVVALGPGLGRGEWGQRMFESVLALDPPRPLVVDADGLNLLADLGADAPSRDNWVLTPHPGEAARLLGVDTNAIAHDRFAAANEIQKRYGGVCVLKGAGTLVAEDGTPAAVCVHGNPGMGAGGMGDVLTGVIAGLIAQGATLGEAARLGVAIHARAGDLAAARGGGERGLLASDLLPEIRTLVNPDG